MPIQNQTKDLIAKLAEAMKNQFEFKPKESSCLCQRPYPEWFERVPLPHQYKITEFFKFLGARQRVIVGVCWPIFGTVG